MMPEAYEFRITEEMQKLRDWLDANNISWEDMSKDSKVCSYWMCRTKFEIGGYYWSVIHGYGSYGGFSHYNSDCGALELMCNAINSGEPVGFLSAQNVIEYISSIEENK